jgi:hypothetical protein
MSAIPVGERRFEIGRVVERTFSVIGRNFVAFYLLTLILSSLPTVVAEALSEAYRDGAAFGLASSLASLAIYLLNFITSLLVQGAVVWGAVADLNGRKAGLGELFRQGAQRALPVLGVSIVMGLATGLGLVLFLVPGLILATVWCTAVPVTVIERPKGLAALSRSADLTRGSRWAIFGLLMLYVVLALIEVTIAATLGRLIGATGPAYIVIVALIDALVVLVGAVGGAVLYVELRAAREGVAPETLASVFD